MAVDTLPETKEQMDELVEQLASEEAARGNGSEPPENAAKGSEKAEKRSEKAARGESEKPDAQITSEHADNEKKPPAKKEKKSSAKKGEEDTAVESDSEKTGKAKDHEEDWREEAKAEASAYGIDEKDIADFESREELDRALKLFDRNLDVERKKVLEAEAITKDKGGETQKKEPEAKPKEEAPADGAYKVALADWWDGDAKAELEREFTRLRDHYESRLAALDERLQSAEERFQTADAAAEEERFDRSVDDLEFSQLFGKTGEEGPDEMERRKELLERVRIEQVVMSRLGRNVDYNALVRRVARATFPDDFDKKLLKNHTRRISRQSDKRQGGGATRPTDTPENPREEAERLYREMEGH